MERGWVKILRKIKDWEWYQDSKTFHLFIHLLLNANRSSKKFKGYDIERGQLPTGRMKLSLDTGMSEQSVRTCLRRLEDSKEISIKSTNKFSIITLCNYNKYQGEEILPNQQLTNNQPTTNQQLTTIKEVKKIRSKEKTDIVLDIFNFWKETHGHNRSKLDAKRRTLINARLKDKYTVDDLKAAILGCKKSKYHQGDNEGNIIYDSITLIMRDADHVDRFIKHSKKSEEGGKWKQLLNDQ